MTVDRVARQLRKVWQPQEGPQSAAYYSLADELLYGGAAGGGKCQRERLAWTLISFRQDRADRDQQRPAG